MLDTSTEKFTWFAPLGQHVSQDVGFWGLACLEVLKFLRELCDPCLFCCLQAKLSLIPVDYFSWAWIVNLSFGYMTWLKSVENDDLCMVVTLNSGTLKASAPKWHFVWECSPFLLHKFFVAWHDRLIPFCLHLICMELHGLVKSCLCIQNHAPLVYAWCTGSYMWQYMLH